MTEGRIRVSVCCQSLNDRSEDKSVCLLPSTKTQKREHQCLSVANHTVIDGEHQCLSRTVRNTSVCQGQKEHIYVCSQTQNGRKESISVCQGQTGEKLCLSRTERITLVAVKDIKDNISVCQGQPRQVQTVVSSRGRTL